MSVRGIEIAKLLILLLLLLLVVVVVVERYGKNGLGSKVPVKKERFPFCKKLLVVHLVFPLSCSHNFLGSLLLKNAGTLEPWNRTPKKPCKSSTYTVPIFSKISISLDRETLNSVLGLELYENPDVLEMQAVCAA